MRPSPRDPIVRFTPPRDAPLRLFCFPHAGAGASAFRSWAAEIDPRIEVFAVQPPGREARFVEPRFTRIAPLVESLLAPIRPLLDRPFAFFGHSLGSLVAFELCRRLRSSGAPAPTHLFVSGRRAAQWPLREECFHRMTDAELMIELRRYNGAPREALEDTELMELLLPVLRADFEMHETYVYDDEAPFDFPVSAFGGTDDATVPAERLDAWRQQTMGAFRTMLLPGDHFYLNASRAALLAAVADAFVKGIARAPLR